LRARAAASGGVTPRTALAHAHGDFTRAAKAGRIVDATTAQAEITRAREGIVKAREQALAEAQVRIQHM
jgi:hypothetical protein